jgi:O-antigen/teichoic acid export membrane protein
MKTPLRNIVAILSGDVGSRVIGFFVTVYLARIFTPASFGLVNLGLAALGYLFLINSPGIQILEVRNAAATEGGMGVRAGAILSMRLFLAPLLLLITAAVLYAGNVPRETSEIILLYGLSLLPLALSFDWLFGGKENFRLITAARLLNACIFGLATVSLVRSDGDVRWTAIAFFAGNVAATLLLGMTYFRRYGAPPFSWDPGAWKVILRENIPVGSAMLLAQSVTNLPPLVIGVLLTNTDVGMYSAGLKLSFVILIIDRTFNAMFLPVATRYAIGRPEDLKRVLDVVLKAIIAFMVPLLVASCIVAGPAVRLVFGPGYEPAVPIFRILTGYVFVTIANSLFVCTLIARERTKEYARIVGFGAGVVFVSVVVLTALMGAPGAAWGTILGETVILVLLFRATGRIAPLPPAGHLLRPALAGGAMAAAAVVTAPLGVPFSLATSAAVFGVAVVLTRGLSLEDLRYLKERLV